MKAIYVAISRAKSSVSIYAKDQNSLFSIEGKSAEKLNVMDLVPKAETSLGQGKEPRMGI